MAHPGFLELKKIVCHATEDLTGSDEIVCVMGTARIPIGRFSRPESRDLSNIPGRAIGSGITTMRIIEVDLIDPDDVLGTINLAQNMDQDRTEPLRSGTAHYELTFRVNSNPD